MAQQSSQAACNVCKLDINTMTDFQRELHFPPDGAKESKISSVFSYQIQLSSWGTHIPVRMDCTTNSENHEFNVDPNFDYLMSTTFRQKIPPIVLNDKYKSRGYEICWPHNLGHVLCEHGEFRCDSGLSGIVNTQILDCHAQFFMKKGAGFREKYMNMIGSVPALEEWNTELPGRTIKVPQPWSYGMDPSWAVPLCRSSKSRWMHTYKFKREILKVLRVRRKKEDGSYKYLKAKAAFFKNIKSDSDQLDQPELWARYAVVNEFERENVRSNPEYPSPMYFTDFVHQKLPNKVSYGTYADVTTDEIQPCVGFMFVAQNCASLAKGNPCNYTTNSDDVKRGFHPISTVSMSHGTAHRFNEIPSDLFSDEEAWYGFPSAPCEPGYFGCSLTHEIGRAIIDIGKSLSAINTKFKFKIDNTDPNLRLDYIRKQKNGGDEDEDLDDVDEELTEDATSHIGSNVTGNDLFYIHMIFMVVRKREFLRGIDKSPDGHFIYDKCRIVDNNIKDN